MKSSVFTWGHCRHTVTYHEGIVSVCVIMILWLSPYLLRCIGGIFYNKILYKIVLKPSKYVPSFLQAKNKAIHYLHYIERYEDHTSECGSFLEDLQNATVSWCVCEMPCGCLCVALTAFLQICKMRKQPGLGGGGRRMSGVSVCVSCGLTA